MESKVKTPREAEFLPATHDINPSKTTLFHPSSLHCAQKNALAPTSDLRSGPVHGSASGLLTPACCVTLSGSQFLLLSNGRAGQMVWAPCLAQ